jgi:hypothetical protein
MLVASLSTDIVFHVLSIFIDYNFMILLNKKLKRCVNFVLIPFKININRRIL